MALDNRINWYIVPDDVPFYEGESAFWPRVDVPADKALTVHEREGHGRTVRTFDWGIAFIPPAPHTVHGDAQDFAGNAPRAKHWIDGVPPVAPCVVVPVWFPFLGFNARLMIPAEIAAAGVAFDAALVDVEDLLSDNAGIAFNAELIEVYGPPPYFGTEPAGFVLGAELIEVYGPPPYFGTEPAGFVLDAELIDPAAAADAGVAFEGDLSAVVAQVDAGIAFNAELIEVESTVSESAGVALDGDVIEESESESAGVGIEAELAEDSGSPFAAGLVFDAALVEP